MTWKEHKAYMLEKWTEFYVHWRYAPLWQWIGQIFMLAALAFLLLSSSHMLIYWMENTAPTPLTEAIFLLAMIAIPLCIIVAMRGLALMIVWIARILNLK